MNSNIRKYSSLCHVYRSTYMYCYIHMYTYACDMHIRICKYICTSIVSTAGIKAQFQIIPPLSKGRVLLSAKECNSVLFIAISDTAFSITIQRHNKQKELENICILIKCQ